MRRKVFPCTKILLVDRPYLGDQDNVSPIWKQLSCFADNFLLCQYELFNLSLNFATSWYCSSRLGTLHGNQDVSPYKQKLFVLSKCFLAKPDNIPLIWTGSNYSGARKFYLQKSQTIRQNIRVTIYFPPFCGFTNGFHFKFCWYKWWRYY